MYAATRQVSRPAVSERHVIYPRLFPPIQAIYSLEAFSLSGDNAIPQAPGGGWG